MRRLAILMAVLSLASGLAPGQIVGDQNEVRSVINAFENALQTRSIAKIETLVAPDIVVFENGYRNDGWADFRDHHLILQFKATPTQYRSELVKVDAGPSIAWGYSRMNRAIIHDDDKRPDVWAVYVLRKEANGWKIVALDWSVRRFGE